jgi:hypothetical protein
VSRDIPPDAMVVKAIQEALQEQGNPPPKIEKLIGKRKTGEDSLKYYFTYTSAVTNRRQIGSATVEKLDTHLWVVNERKIIQR